MPEWIRVDTDLLDHKKTIKLSRALGEPEYATAGRLFGLWSFAQINAWRDGDLSIWGPEGIERAARWTGESGKFYKAISSKDIGLMDEMVIHNWRQYTAEYVKVRIRRDKKKNSKKPVRTQSVQCTDKKRTNRHTSVTSRHVTLPRQGQHITTTDTVVGVAQ